MIAAASATIGPKGRPLIGAWISPRRCRYSRLIADGPRPGFSVATLLSVNPRGTFAFADTPIGAKSRLCSDGYGRRWLGESFTTIGYWIPLIWSVGTQFQVCV